MFLALDTSLFSHLMTGCFCPWAQVFTLISWLDVFNLEHNPDSNVYGANIGLTWGQQDPGGRYVGPMNFAICEAFPHLVIECF